MGLDFKENTQAVVVSRPCLVPLSSFWTILNSISSFFHPPSTFSFHLTAVFFFFFIYIRYLSLTACSVCSNELGDSTLNTTRVTLKQNRREKGWKDYRNSSHLARWCNICYWERWTEGEGRSEDAAREANTERRLGGRKSGRQGGWHRRAVDFHFFRDHAHGSMMRLSWRRKTL